VLGTVVALLVGLDATGGGLGLLELFPQSSAVYTPLYKPKLSVC